MIDKRRELVGNHHFNNKAQQHQTKTGTEVLVVERLFFSEFFAKCGIIDYSLLVGVHELSKHQTCKQDSASEISIHQSDIENTPQMSGRHSKPHEHQIRKKFNEADVDK